MVMKIRCTHCGSAKFTYTARDSDYPAFHGARCAHCRKRLLVQDLLPDTKVDPIAHCLIDSYKKVSGT